jgi:hypothetical protein
MRTTPWTPSSDVVTAVGLTADQLEQIRANETEFVRLVGDARKAEKQARLRYIRMLARDPVAPDLVQELEDRFLTAARGRMEIETTRIKKLRMILNRDQWIRLLEVDTTPVRIGSFQPRPIVRVHVAGDWEGNVHDNDTEGGAVSEPETQ